MGGVAADSVSCRIMHNLDLVRLDTGTSPVGGGHLQWMQLPVSRARHDVTT